DKERDRKVGTFRTEASGRYSFGLPNGGSFRFLVSMKGSSKVHEGDVKLPKLDKPRRLKQQMEIRIEAGEEQLVIQNLFDESVGEEAPAVTAAMLKKQASLEVNASEETTTEEEVGPTVEILDEPETTEPEAEPELTEDEIVKTAYAEADALRIEADELEKQTAQAYGIARDKSKAAADKTEEVNRLQAANGDATQVDALIGEASSSARQASVAFDLATQLENRATKKRSEATRARQYADEIEQAVNESSADASLAKLQQLKTLIANSESESAGVDQAFESSRGRVDAKTKEAAAASQKAEQLTRDIASIEEEITYYEEEIPRTKDRAIKEELQAQLRESNSLLTQARKDRDVTLKQAADLNREAEELEAEHAAMQDLVTSIKAGNAPEAPGLSVDEKQQLAQQISEVETSTGQFNEAAEASADTEAEEQARKASDEQYLEKLAKAERAEDELDRESLKAQLYGDWADNLQADIEGREQRLATAEASEQQDLQQQIDDLRTKEQQYRQLSEKSFDRVAALNDYQASKTEGTASEEAPAVEIVTQTPEPDATAALEQRLTDNTDNEDFRQQLQEAEQLADPTARITQRAAVQQAWIEDLDTELTALNAASAEASNPAVRVKVDQRITELERLKQQQENGLVESRQQATDLGIALEGEAGSEAAATAAADAQPEPAAAGSGATGPVERYNVKTFSDRMIAIANIADDQERVQAVRENNEAWLASLNNEIQILEDEVANAPSERDRMELESRKRDLQALADRKAEELEAAPLVVDAQDSGEEAPVPAVQIVSNEPATETIPDLPD
ncbi:MAG: hypothetical protein AAGB22_05510, partial [Bacteroidota bacterium]